VIAVLDDPVELRHSRKAIARMPARISAASARCLLPRFTGSTIKFICK
jgi:hypothetical protein